MTPAEKSRRFDKLRELGCVCCLLNQDNGDGMTSTPVEIHHLNGGGHHGQKRRGDEFTIPLCSYHHRAVPAFSAPYRTQAEHYGPSWAKGSKPFRAVYGTDDELLALVNSLIEPIPYTLPEAK